MKINKLLPLTFAIALTSLVTNAAVTKTDQMDNNKMIVTAKANSNIDGIAASVDVITAEDIKQSGAKTLKDILKQVAGINFQSVFYGRETPMIRGVDELHILTLIDGKRTNLINELIAGSIGFQTSYFNIKNIQRIEIIKGANSVLYGSGAMGGVINIITKTGNKKPYAGASIHKGSLKRNGGDTTGISFGVGGGNDEIYATLGASKNQQNVVKDSTGTRALFQATENQIMNANVAFKMDDHSSIEIGLMSNKEKRNVPKEIRTPAKFAYFDDYIVKRKSQDIAYKTKISGWDTTFKAYQMTTNASHYDVVDPNAYTYTHIIKDTIMSAEARKNIDAKQYLILGIERHKSDYERDYTPGKGTDYKATGTTQSSFYVQDKISLDPGTLILGARVDNHSQFGKGNSLSLGYSHPLDYGMVVKFSAASAFKAPSIEEGDANYSLPAYYGKRLLYISKGNGDLKPETSKNFEISLSGKNANSDWSIAVFENKIKDLIDYEITDVTDQSKNNLGAKYKLFTNININKANIKGLEAAYNIDLSNSLFLDTSFTTLKTNDGKGQELLYRPKNLLKAKLTKNFSDDIVATLSANHIGSFLKKVNDRTKAYTIVNTAINKRFDKNITAQFAINNLTDKRLDSPVDNARYELLGREIKLTLSVDF